MNTSQTRPPMPADASSDAELVSLSVAGNDLAFAQIMRRYNRLLFRTGPAASAKATTTRKTHCRRLICAPGGRYLHGHR